VVIDRFTVDPELLETRCQRFEMLIMFPDTVPQVRFQLEPGQVDPDLVERTGCAVVESTHAYVLYRVPLVTMWF
jgi:hypothetical protein